MLTSLQGKIHKTPEGHASAVREERTHCPSGLRPAAPTDALIHWLLCKACSEKCTQASGAGGGH